MPKRSVVGPDLTPDWLDRRRAAMDEMDRQLIHGVREPGKGLSLEQLTAVNQHRDPFRLEGEAREHPLRFGDAIEILGADKVISPKAAAKVWDFSADDFSNRHLCPEQFLLEAAEENEQGEDWRLVFIPPVSYLEARLMMNKLFYQKKWWLEGKQRHWTACQVGPRVELLNFRSHYGFMSWPAQEDQIALRGWTYRRAHDLAVALTILSVYQLNDGESLLPDLFHWGISETAERERVSVGLFDQRWLVVGNTHPAGKDSGVLRVCLAREFHTGLLAP